ncbi:MAG: hypothetical protein JWO33_1465 [Caulobacteraceae bacterium]|nr:hypothetical protein [Caulobacteraceae bacterium]
MGDARAPEQCVILVGGLGTRLGALTVGLPKPMVPVGGRPFLSYLIWHAKRFGFRKVLLLAGHRAERIAEEIPSLSQGGGLEISVAVEPEPLGTGGALRFAADRLDERFLLMNGDSLFDFNWLDLVTAMHDGVQAVLSLRHEPDASRYGVVDLDGDRVIGFRERGDASGGLINGGVYLLDRAVAEGSPRNGSFEREVLPALAAAGKVRGRRQSGFFLDIGIPDALAAAQEAVPASLKRPAVFFDRDGVINVDHGYVHRIDDFAWIDGAAAAVKAVNDRNLFAFLVTNQGGVGRGFYGEDDVRALHAHLQAELRKHGAHLDDIRFCPHHPDAVTPELARPCDWRKPGAGMFTDLASHWPIEMGRSLMVGDKESDIQAGQAAGVKSRLFEGGDLAAFLAPELESL